MADRDGRLHIVVAADGLPPNSGGGAAWSTLALCQALLARGHHVTAVVPRAGGRGVQRRMRGDLSVVEVGYRAPRIPIVQNYLRFERLWPRLATAIVDVASAYDLPVVIHGQHSQSGPAAVLAGRKLHVPAVVTVRDHWPWDYFATGLHADRIPYPRNTFAGLLTDLVTRQGPVAGTLLAPSVPYLLRHVRRRARLLGAANAVIAVSTYMAKRLRPIVPCERLHVIPNMVDLDHVQTAIASPQVELSAEPFVLFVGKLERNKGADLLPAIMAGQRDPPLLVIAGNGSLRESLAEQLAAQGTRFTLLPGWTDHDVVLQLMARAQVLLFPSGWGEPLSRVLLEAMAAGACVVAMPTGGTPDIIVDGVNGMLVGSVQAFGQAVDRLLHNPATRLRMSAGSVATARERFAAPVVVARVEALYHTLLP